MIEYYKNSEKYTKDDEYSKNSEKYTKDDEYSKKLSFVLNKFGMFFGEVNLFYDNNRHNILIINDILRGSGSRVDISILHEHLTNDSKYSDIIVIDSYIYLFWSII